MEEKKGKMKKKKLEENYLERIPLINDKYSYKQEEDGKISIIIYNRGISTIPQCSKKFKENLLDLNFFC